MLIYRILVYEHIYKFFKRCPSGTFYLMLIPQRINLVAAVGATSTFTVGTGAVTSDTLMIAIGAINLFAAAITLSTGNQTATATAIASAINAYTSTSGCSATASGANFTVTLPSGLGDLGNNITPLITKTGTVALTGTATSGGVTQVGTIPIVVGVRATSAYAIGTGSISGDTWTSSIGPIALLATPLVLGTLSKSAAATAIVAAINAYTSTSGCTAVTTGGGGFTVTLPLSAGATYNGTNPTVTETGTIITTVGDVVDTSITNAGSGYTSAPAVTITGGGGSGATATANAMSTGTSATVVIDNTGISSQTPGTVIQVQDWLTSVLGSYTTHIADTDSLITGQLSAAINAATSTNGGYTASSTGALLTVTAPVSLGATPNTQSCNVFAGITLLWGDSFAGGVTAVSTVTTITITNPGSGYTSAPTIAFSGGGGTGAAATAIIAGPSTAGAVTGGVTAITTQPVSLSMMLDMNGSYAPYLLRNVMSTRAAAGLTGGIRQLGAVLNPDTAALAAETAASGISDDTTLAVAKAQALADYAYAAFYPVDILIEGRRFNATPTNAINARGLGSGQVGLVLGQDPAVSSQVISSATPYQYYAAVGDALGCVAQCKVDESIGNTTLNLTDTADGTFLTANLSSGLSIDNYSIGTMVGGVVVTGLDTLYDKGYIVPRIISGRNGIYWGGGPTCTAIDQDDAFIEDSRTLNKASIYIRKAFIPYINAVIPTGPDGAIAPTTVAQLQASAESQLDQNMTFPGEISGRSVTIITRDVNGNPINFIDSGEVVPYVAQVEINGIAREISGTVALVSALS